MNTKGRLSERNTCKEHLLYNENELNAKNIDIAFDPRQLFDPEKYFINPSHPRQNFIDPRYPCYPH